MGTIDLSYEEAFVTYLGLMRTKRQAQDDLDALKHTSHTIYAERAGLPREELERRIRAVDSVVSKMKEEGLV